MNRIHRTGLLGLALAGAMLLPAELRPAENNAAAAAAAHRATLDQYCVACHGAALKTAGLDLEGVDPADLARNGAVWEKLLRKLRNREMPPAGMPRPDPAAYDALVAYIETGRGQAAALRPNPGRPTLHRLNRAEYANAIRDLLAVEVDSTELLPADDIGYGFDNIGDVLSVSPLLLERYLNAASRIARAAIGDTATPPAYQTYNIPRGLVQLDRAGEELPLGSRGGASVRHHFPVDGEYVISVKLQTGRYDQILGLERERQLDLRLDEARLERFTIAANPTAGAQVHGQARQGRTASPPPS
jgi:mono/diheme cytochrome c family protein